MKHPYIGSLLALGLSGAANSAVVNVVCNVKNIAMPSVQTVYVSFSPDKRTFSVKDRPEKFSSISVTDALASGTMPARDGEIIKWELNRVTGELVVTQSGGDVLMSGPCVPAGKGKF